MELNRKEITDAVIAEALEGRDPEKRIVNVTYNNRDNFVTVFYRDEKDRKCSHKAPFYPFCWATRQACLKLCNGDRIKISELLKRYNIRCIALDDRNNDGSHCEQMKNGYLFMFKAQEPMSYSTFLDFFKRANNPVYSNSDDSSDSKNNQYLIATPVEQYLISTGKRFFKGYDDYNQILKMTFDLETEGLDPKKHRIEWYGIKFNRPVTYKGEKKEFNKELQLTGLTKEEKDRNELKMIDTALRIIYTFRPDVITGHNSENFDWSFIIERCKQLGSSIEEMSSKYFNGRSIGKKQKETTLKLGGEVEHFYQTIVPDIIITDSLHAVRRAQATDSNFKEANLKYATKYLGLVKKNRVYVPGDSISEISNDYSERYAFNDNNGDWYVYDPSKQGEEFGAEPKIDKTKKFILSTRNKLFDGYTLVNGHYIVERYLGDDLTECEDVEYTLNSVDFSLTKILPLSFQKAVTMGTAGQWKAIMMAWSYENNLAIPKPENEKMTVGGLSRLLKVGVVKNVVKLDYNSLYPSIILTWGISDKTDLMNAMLKMLEYVLTNREKHKKLKKAADKKKTGFEERMNNGESLNDNEMDEYLKACNEFKAEDNRQACVKKLGNSFFGSYGSVSGAIFPWKSLTCAERTTCTGRQSLRLMISHFAKLGYQPIVGDSFMPDTPLFIKYNDSGYIDIKPIGELINEDEIKIDALGREYDYSKKDYKVLCRSGWVEPSYTYRHKTNKDIYEVTEGNMLVEVTEDHSLFNDKQEKIKPSQINGNTKLEYYTKEIKGDKVFEAIDNEKLHFLCERVIKGLDRGIPISILNGTKENMKEFYDYFMSNYRSNTKYSKTCLAGLQYIKKMVS